MLAKDTADPDGRVADRTPSFANPERVHHMQMRRASDGRVQHVARRLDIVVPHPDVRPHHTHPVLYGARDGIDEVRLRLGDIDQHICLEQGDGKIHLVDDHPAGDGDTALVGFIHVDDIRAHRVGCVVHAGDRHHLFRGDAGARHVADDGATARLEHQARERRYDPRVRRHALFREEEDRLVWLQQHHLARLDETSHTAERFDRTAGNHIHGISRAPGGSAVQIGKTDRRSLAGDARHHTPSSKWPARRRARDFDAAKEEPSQRRSPA